MTDQPAALLRQAAERLRGGDRRIDIALRGQLANWLDDAAEGDDHGGHNPYAVDFAQAVLRRRTPIQGSGYTTAGLLGGVTE